QNRRTTKRRGLRNASPLPGNSASYSLGPHGMMPMRATSASRRLSRGDEAVQQTASSLQATCWFFGYAHPHPNDRMLASRVTVGAHREPKMSSTHEPSQLLEPSNLLEPLDLSERQLNFEYPSARSDRGGTSQRGSTRATRREFMPRPTEDRNR